ncbi:MAG: acyl-CoA dehydrogenase family protein, partial [Myxococcales bacterium]|nr:acyl-CoA dehydrogenase family protein [Myxococcales bacterium]
MEFSLPPELETLRNRVRAFVDSQVVPVEEQLIAQDRDGSPALLRELQDRVKGEGLWTPHLPAEYGGLGLGALGMAALFRAMGRSLVGPRVFNCDAPDQGNMELLLQAASPQIRAKYLE